MLVAEGDQHVAPVVAAGEAPDGGTQDVVLAAAGIGQEAAAPQGVRQPEDAAAVDAEQIRQLAQRNRVARFGDRLQDEQTAVKTLDRWGLQRGFLHWTWSDGRSSIEHTQFTSVFSKKTAPQALAYGAVKSRSSGESLDPDASELKFQAEHHLASVARGGCLAEGAVGLCPGGAPLGGRADGAELRVVEGVEGLPPELQRLPLGRS